MRYLTLLCSLLLSILSFSQTASNNLSVVFEYDSDKLTPQAKELLKNYVNSLDVQRIVEFKLSGHTDQDGSEEYNNSLSERRAQNTAQVLKELLRETQANEQVVVIPAIDISWHGEGVPIVETSDNSPDPEHTKLAQNRRVDIEVIYQDDLGPQSESWYFEEYSKDVQKFKINPSKGTTIKGKKGTIVIIPEGAICNGETYFSAELQLEEYYDYSEIIMAGLSTTSEGDLIETAGMVNVKLMKDGKELELCDTISILFPRDKDLSTEGFQGFSGEWDDEHLNWTAMHDPLDILPGDDLSEDGNLAWPSGGNMPDVQIRCGLLCRFGIANERRGIIIDSRFRRDEVKRTFRRASIFKTKVGYDDYKNRYEEIKLSMKDTFSAVSLLRFNPNNIINNGEEYFEKLSKGQKLNEGMLNAATNYIVVQTTEVGMINCDRFTASPNKINFKVPIAKAVGVAVGKLIFKRVKGIMQGVLQSDEMQFNNIPRGEEATLLLMKYHKGEVYIANSDLKVGDVPEVEFRKIKRTEIENELKRIFKED